MYLSTSTTPHLPENRVLLTLPVFLHLPPLWDDNSGRDVTVTDNKCCLTRWRCHSCTYRCPKWWINTVAPVWHEAKHWQRGNRAGHHLLDPLVLVMSRHTSLLQSSRACFFIHNKQSSKARESTGLPRTATHIAGCFTCQAATLKMFFLHNNVTASEMPFPRCLFPDEILLLIYTPTTCAWKLRDIHESEISGDHQVCDAASTSFLPLLCS